jgi:protein dithiol oxidoreductase (disulfide-forming)
MSNGTKTEVNPTRRTLLAAIGAAAVAAALVRVPPALAQGRPFTEVAQLPVESGDKIEVAEFFSYGCIHCYNLEPNIEAWLKRLPPDVHFRRIPAVFNQRMAMDAAIYYALEAGGMLDKLHKPLFDAIHKNGLKTHDNNALADWLLKQGVDPVKFADAMKSFGVQSKVRRAAQHTLGAKIDGTPAMLVQGRYSISAEQAGRDGFMKAVDQVVEVARKKK